MTDKKKVAVIGSGITGLSAAWALRDTADVTLFESADRFGGHSCTIDIQSGGKTIPVDVGFIVCNPLNYPNFMNFMSHLGVGTVQSDMSFAVSDKQGFEWSSNPEGLFAYKRNLFSPSFLKLLGEILSFNKKATSDAENESLLTDLTLGQYLDRMSASQTFRNQYLLPMGAAIWSTPEARMEEYPAISFIRFFNNHRLLHRERPKWRTVAGGSRSYVDVVVKALGSRAQCGRVVENIRRTSKGADVLVDGHWNEFDEVVLACHAPQAHALLGDGFEHQKSILAPIQVTKNVAYLHKDTSLMPRRRAAWASWNVLKHTDDEVTLSYWMNRLQKLDTDETVLVTLNPHELPKPELTYDRFEFDHPLFTKTALERVENLKRVNGRDGLWIAGAWMGHGFHEDGLKSGLAVALSLGAQLPWTPTDIAPYSTETPNTLERPAVNQKVAIS